MKHFSFLLTILLFLSFQNVAKPNPACDRNGDQRLGMVEAFAALQDGYPEPAIYTLQILTGRNPTPFPAQQRYNRVAPITSWFYYLGFNPDYSTIQMIIDSTYEMVVLEPIFTEKENSDFPIADVISDLHNAQNPKIVLAYLDIGQAEEWRTYWQPGWGIGNPSWIVANDPDGWEGNYPVKYWHTDWKSIWLGQDGYLQQMIDAGFDGIYLDWIEAFSDENVTTAAVADGVNPENEMVTWVGELAAYARNQDPDFLVIGQNAAELSYRDDYLDIIDAVAQEQTWFDGASDNTPPGDCPLPATDNDIETPEYENSLQLIDQNLGQTEDGCYRMYLDYPDSTLHVSTEWYLEDLQLAKMKCEIIFTVDYGVLQNNIDAVYQNSRALGFTPYVGERALDTYIHPVP